MAFRRTQSVLRINFDHKISLNYRYYTIALSIHPRCICQNLYDRTIVNVCNVNLVKLGNWYQVTI